MVKSEYLNTKGAKNSDLLLICVHNYQKQTAKQRQKTAKHPETAKHQKQQTTLRLRLSTQRKATRELLIQCFSQSQNPIFIRILKR